MSTDGDLPQQATQARALRLRALLMGIAALCFAVLVVLDGHLLYWLAFAANLVGALLIFRASRRSRI